MLLGVQAKAMRPVEQILFRLVNGWAGGWARGRSGGRAQSGWMVGRASGGGAWMSGRAVGRAAVGGAVGRNILIYDRWL